MKPAIENIVSPIIFIGLLSILYNVIGSAH